jgi:diguanylate cyclase (GGDEF)-like protein/PAS domain S-box-containing protein
MEFNPLSIYVLLCGAMTVGIANYAWRRRTAVGARWFALFMLSLSIYILGYSMELASTELAGMLFWSKVEYIGILTYPALYLMFAAEYSGREGWPSRPLAVLLWVIPGVLWSIKLFDESLHLIYASVSVDAVGVIPLLAFTRGPLYLLIAGYNILLLTAGNYLLLMRWRFASPLYRGQAGIMLAAALVIYGSYLFYLAGIPVVVELKDLDINPFVYTLWGLAVGWAIFRYRLFDLAPVAREALIEALKDGVVVLDGQARIVDANPEAMRLFGWRRMPAGRTAVEALAGWIDAPALADRSRPIVREAVIAADGAEKVFEVTVSPLKRKDGLFIGHLALVHDVSDRKEIERRLRESSLKDELTGLHNRRGFKLLAEQLIRMALRMRWDLLLFYIDLDGLKQINDRRGHAAGDRALIEAATLLKGSFRSSDVVARLGGDEFAVLAVGGGDSSGPSMLARLGDRRRRRNARPGREYRLEMSVGVARLEWGNSGSLDSLLDAADRAMYTVKNAKPEDERRASVLPAEGG